MATAIAQFGEMTQGSDADVEKVLIAWADRNVPLGVCDEAPYQSVEIACENRRAVVAVLGNIAYFDGEQEIMVSQCQYMARRIASIVQD